MLNTRLNERRTFAKEDRKKNLVIIIKGRRWKRITNKHVQASKQKKNNCTPFWVSSFGLTSVYFSIIIIIPNGHGCGKGCQKYRRKIKRPPRNSESRNGGEKLHTHGLQTYTYIQMRVDRKMNESVSEKKGN